MNVRMALKDATLPIGGGKSGRDPVAVPKDTTISKWHCQSNYLEMYQLTQVQSKSTLSVVFNAVKTFMAKMRSSSDLSVGRELTLIAGTLSHTTSKSSKPFQIWLQETEKLTWRMKSGPRHCLGQKFGQQQMEYILARICQEYQEIRIPAGQPEQQIRIELNLKMAHPCMCEFVKKGKGN